MEVPRISKFLDSFIVLDHRRRIKTEETAKKGRRFFLGGGIYSIPCSAHCFVLDDLNYRMKEKGEFILFFKIGIAKIASAARS